MILKKELKPADLKRPVSSLIQKKKLKLIAIIIGYVVLHIYHVGIFSMRYQHVDERLNVK